jgi:hypothetical protein
MEKLHSEERRKFHSSPRIIRSVRWAGRVARMGEMRNVCAILFGKSEWKRDHREDQDIDDRVILKRILRK